MPTANEMFNSYFAPAAADWQKESHLRTNAEARAKMQEMEDAHMAEWRKSRAPAPEPIKAPEVPMTARPPIVPEAVTAKATEIATSLPKAVDMTPLMTHYDSIRAKKKAEVELWKAKARKLKSKTTLTPEQEEAYINRNSLIDLSKVDPDAASEVQDQLMTQKAQADQERLNAYRAAGGYSIGSGSQSAGDITSEKQAYTGPSVAISGSRTGNEAVTPLVDPIQDYIANALGRKGPDTSEQEERANFIRGELPRLERELMLTGGAEEYRKRLATERAAIAAANTAFGAREDDLLKTSLGIMKEAGTSERQAVKLASDSAEAALSRGSKERIAEIAAKARNYAANARSNDEIFRLVGTLYGHATRLIGQEISSDTRIQEMNIYKGTTDSDAVKYGINRAVNKARQAELAAVIGSLFQDSGRQRTAMAALENAMQTNASGMPILRGTGGGGYNSSPATEGEWTVSGYVPGKPAVRSYIPSTPIALPGLISAKPERTPNPPDKPKTPRSKAEADAYVRSAATMKEKQRRREEMNKIGL